MANVIKISKRSDIVKPNNNDIEMNDCLETDSVMQIVGTTEDTEEEDIERVYVDTNEIDSGDISDCLSEPSYAKKGYPPKSESYGFVTSEEEKLDLNLPKPGNYSKRLKELSARLGIGQIFKTREDFDETFREYCAES